MILLKTKNTALISVVGELNLKIGKGLKNFFTETNSVHGMLQSEAPETYILTQIF